MAVSDAGNGTSRRLDWRMASRAAMVAVLVTVPVTVLSRLLEGDDANGEGSSWVVGVVAMFTGFTLAGNFAARRSPGAPLVHAAAAAAMAFGLLAAATVVRRLATGDGVSAPLVITLGLLLQITVSLAMLGAYLGIRRRGRERHSS